MPSRAMVPVLVGMMLLTGVCNTLLTKYQDMQCIARCDTKHPRMFEQPVMQTLQMFVGESGCWLVVFLSYLFRIARGNRTRSTLDDVAYRPIDEEQAYADDEDDNDDSDEDAPAHMSGSQTLVDPTNVVAKPLIDADGIEREPLSGWKVTLLALPAICDICGTTLMNVGLLFVAASIYQMTRGALVLFVGLFSFIFLKRHLPAWKWASLVIVVAGVAVVGLANVLANKESPPTLPGHIDENDVLAKTMLFVRQELSVLEAHTAAESLLGFFLIALAQIFTATQFVLEESIMERYSMEPIRVVGWEGVFGFLFTLLGMGILHAAVGRTAAGQGGYFDARQGFYEIFHYPTIGVTSLLIMVSIGGFNFFGLSVTRSLSATARSTIDTCRTLFIWIVSLGLGWETFKWLQIVGFVLLVWGTALFNEIVQPPTLALLRGRKPAVALES